MNFNRKFFFIVVVLSFIALWIGLVVMDNDERVSPDVAVRKAVITINEEKIDLFFDQMKVFAERYGFAIRVAPTAPTGKDFVVEMWREDFKILAANPFDKGSFRVSVFNILGREIEDKYVDDLMENLMVYTLKVENARFLQQPGNNTESE